MSAACNWERINDFYSLIEFKSFLKWIEEQKNNGLAIELEAKSKYDFNLQERWFKCLITNEIWRLVYPDFPFVGLWEQVKD